MKNKFSSSKQMITYRSLGEMGRLGNQMFEYASTRGIANNRNFDCGFPLPNDDIILYKCFKNTLKHSKQLPHYDVVYAQGFHFDEILFNECVGGRDLLHFFQSEKYFKHIRDEIKSDFTFDDFIFNSCKTYIEEMYGDTEVISLHVRRSDYLTDETLYPVSLDYYKEAINLLDPNIPILVISDDIDWCEQQDIFSPKRFNFIKSKNHFVDLCIMTLCNYHIIANSSFSWWGAWLAESKQVIAPKRWFRWNNNTWITDDLYCPEWIVL